MAPIPPLGRTAALAQIRAGRLPIWLGSPHPSAMILEQAGRFRVRDLVIDPAEATAARDAALAGGKSWLPEQYYELGKPIGTLHVDAASLEELAKLVEAMAWPATW